jgi:anaerobic carbon-monoxide dehydrogenase iron sulfur subunit
MKTLVIDINRCTGCHQCELACSFRKLRKFSPCDSRIQIVSWEDRCLSIPVVCMQCKDAPCARVCPVGAIQLDSSSGAYKVDSDRCLGCKMCALVCPFAAIVSDRHSGKAIKCDLCDGDPACASVCAAEALRFEELAHAGDVMKREVGTQIKASLIGEEANLPSGPTKLGGTG